MVVEAYTTGTPGEVQRPADRAEPLPLRSSAAQLGPLVAIRQIRRSSLTDRSRRPGHRSDG
jgi:hypothetical protein